VSRYLVLVVGILVAAACVRLGVWQLDRLGQRRSRNAIIETALAAPAIDLGASSTGVDSLQYRRVRARGAFDFEREIVVMARAHDGVPAVHVVTPFRLDDDTAVLVERGWVPSPDGRTVDLLPLRESGSTAVEGVVIPFSNSPPAEGRHEGWPRYVRSANPVELASAYPYALLPIVVRRTEVPPENPSVLRRAPLPELTNGPHFSYAVQWFSFATIALVGCGVLFGKLGVRGKLGTRE
jgi:surfeit locus 1 family protein